MTRFNVSFDGVMDRLEELEKENHRLRAEVSAMRPIVEAVADIENSGGSACLQLCDTMYLTTPTERAWRVQHRANCVIEQARAYVAQHPTSDGRGGGVAAWAND